MRRNRITLRVLILALPFPLMGCLETVGHPSYNHGPSSSHEATCRPLSQSAGEVINYGCRPRP
jgi:hypothetical protein